MTCLSLRAFGCSLLLAGAHCGGAWPEVVDTRSLFGGGSPSIDRVRDVGSREPPESGEFTGEPDGVASPGELLLIEGSGFGKQPTVTVAGRAAEVVARTRGGGILVRVPVAVPTGAQPIEVTVGEARSRKEFPLRRLTVALHEGKLHVMAVEGGALSPIGALDVPGARSVRLSSDGAVAYVLQGTKKIAIVDLGAPTAPALLMTRDLEISARTLVASDRAARLFAVGEDAIQGFDTTHPRTPARYAAAPLPEAARRAQAADLDPEARRLALLLPEGNRVLFVELASPTEARAGAEVRLLPEARVPLLRDCRFAADGETLWVVSGDNAASIDAGVQPTRMSGVRIDGERASLWRTSPVQGGGAPVALLVPRQAPLAAGTTIRLAPEKSTLYYTAVPSALLTAPSTPGGGALDQADMAGGRGHLVETKALLGAIDASDDARGAVVLSVDGGHDFGAAWIDLAPPYALRFLRLAAATARDLAPPFRFGEVRVQP